VPKIGHRLKIAVLFDKLVNFWYRLLGGYLPSRLDGLAWSLILSVEMLNPLAGCIQLGSCVLRVDLQRTPSEKNGK
jgi:hypothetical protein